MPKPIIAEFIRFWIGNTSDSAVIASSLIFATKKLSTILYIEFTSIEMTIGSDILAISGSIFSSFI